MVTAANFDLADRRKQWNQNKDTVALWWAENSKEACSSGLADLAQALDNWKASANGTRKAGRQLSRRIPGSRGSSQRKPS